MYTKSEYIIGVFFLLTLNVFTFTVKSDWDQPMNVSILPWVTFSFWRKCNASLATSLFLWAACSSVTSTSHIDTCATRTVTCLVWCWYAIKKKWKSIVCKFYLNQSEPRVLCVSWFSNSNAKFTSIRVELRQKRNINLLAYTMNNPTKQTFCYSVFIVSSHYCKVWYLLWQLSPLMSSDYGVKA